MTWSGKYIFLQKIYMHFYKIWTKSSLMLCETVPWIQEFWAINNICWIMLMDEHEQLSQYIQPRHQPNPHRNRSESNCESRWPMAHFIKEVNPSLL